MRAWNECDNEHSRDFCENLENAHIKLRFVRSVCEERERERVYWRKH